MMAASTVSRETHRALRSRKVTQPRGDRTRERLIEAVIAFAKAGRYRASSREIGQFAGVHHTAVHRHFGHLKLLYRVVARERWQEVAATLPAHLPCVTEGGHQGPALVWTVLVGEPRDGAF